MMPEGLSKLFVLRASFCEVASSQCDSEVAFVLEGLRIRSRQQAPCKEGLVGREVVLGREPLQ